MSVNLLCYLRTGRPTLTVVTVFFCKDKLIWAINVLQKWVYPIFETNGCFFVQCVFMIFILKPFCFFFYFIRKNSRPLLPTIRKCEKPMRKWRRNCVSSLLMLKTTTIKTSKNNVRMSQQWLKRFIYKYGEGLHS